MHPLFGALPVLFVQVRVAHIALIAYLYAYEPPRCRTTQYGRAHFSISVDRSW